MRTLTAMFIATLIAVPVLAVGLSGLVAAPLGSEEGTVQDAARTSPGAATSQASSSTTESTDQTTDAQDTAVKPNAQPTYSRSGYDVTPYSREKVAELAKKLSPEAYRITQNAGTEPAFCGTLLDNKKDGTYCCVVCGLPLFSSAHKFNSGTGWPSFFQPFDIAHVGARQDNSHGMERVEILCTRCDSHLGHVFDDGPRPTGLRFCLNGAALVFHEKGTPLPPESQPLKTEAAYFAGGCFWGIEHYFQQAPGVITAESGYMQGTTDNPTYKEVCTQDEVPFASRPAGFKGHAEVVKVVFDPTRITYRQLLEGFFEMHDPTQLNRQGPDYGTQYRSGLYTVGADQEAEARRYVAELGALASFNGSVNGRKIVTEIEPAKTFYSAETYHQDYLEKNPTRGCHIGKPWWLTKKAPAAGSAPADTSTETVR